MKKVLLAVGAAMGFSATFDDGTVVRMEPGTPVELDDDKADALASVSGAEETTDDKGGKKGGSQPGKPGGGGRQED